MIVWREGATERRQNLPYLAIYYEFVRSVNTSKHSDLQHLTIDFDVIQATLTTKMAVLLDLSGELIILIASNIRKPSHMLALALANKRIHAIAIEQLYERITFDQDDYPPFPSLLTNWNSGNTPSIIRYGDTTPHSNILRLSNMIRLNTVPKAQMITRLTIIIGVNHDWNRFQTLLSLLLPELSSLRNLTLKSVSEDRLAWRHEQFSLAAFGAALNNTSQTLRSLSIHFSLDPKHDDGWTFGSLRHFSKLKYLSIQGSVFLGQNGFFAPQMLSLDSVLPQGLERLRLHWCIMYGLRSLYVVLSNFVKDSSRVARNTEEIVVQLDAKTLNRLRQYDLELFERNLTGLNEQARREGLDLKMALEVPEGYHRVAQPFRLEGQLDRNRRDWTDSVK